MTISQITPYISNAINNGERIPAQQTTKPTPPPSRSTDTVKLSDMAQVLSLRHQGYSPEKIASQIGYSRQTVDRLLDIHHSKKKI
jgi:hypothetical protein